MVHLFHVILAIVGVLSLSNESSQISIAPKTIIGDIHYFTDPTNGNRNRANALQYCKDEALSAGTSSGLAKINSGPLFNAVPSYFPDGSYWIDGADEGTFTDAAGGNIDFSFLPAANNRLVPRSCAVLVKGSSRATTYIQNQDCNVGLRALCEVSLT